MGFDRVPAFARWCEYSDLRGGGLLLLFDSGASVDVAAAIVSVDAAGAIDAAAATALVNELKCVTKTVH